MRTHTCMQAHTHARTHTPSPPSPQTEQPKQRHKRHCAVCALRPAPASGTHVVEHGGPPFHGDALEDGQHRKKDVIELRDPVVRADPVLAFIAGWAALHTARVRGVESFQDTCGHIRRVRGKPQGVQRELERASGSAQVCPLSRAPSPLWLLCTSQTMCSTHSSLEMEALNHMAPHFVQAMPLTIA